MYLYGFLCGFELPRHTIVVISHKLHCDNSAIVNFNKLFLRVDTTGLPVEARDVTKDIVKRHQRKTEAEHTEHNKQQSSYHPFVVSL